MSHLLGDITFPLQTGQVGTRMVTMVGNGNRLKLACVNWYGAHMEDLVVNGLDVQPIENIAEKIAELGFNCVRLPFALDNIFKNPVIKAERLTANPGLVGMTAMEVFDETIKALTDAKIIILPNNHMSTAMWCCSYDDGEGLWYTDEYPEEDFIEGWRQITTRYKDNPWVAGMDLRNELRPSHRLFMNRATLLRIRSRLRATAFALVRSSGQGCSRRTVAYCRLSCNPLGP